MGDLKDLQDSVVRFRDNRDWLQYHTPKNLSMALAGEVGELIDLYLWDREPDSEMVRLEMADVLIYLLSMADVLEIDLVQAVRDKIFINWQKYPAFKAKGNCDKADMVI